MKNRKINLIGRLVIILFFLPVLHACSDFLEQEPGSQVSITEQLGSIEGMNMALVGAYSSLESHLRNEEFAVYADLLGGNLGFSPIPSGSNKGQVNVPFNVEKVYSFNDEAIESDFEDFYAESYDIINQANLILEYADELPDASPSEIEQFKAEALAIRGFAHYVLSLLYAQDYSFTPDASHPGIVYQTESLDEELTYPARETVAVTYNLIIEDMERALELMTGESALPGPEYSYFNSMNIKALLARIYLSKNEWQQAFDYADDVIKNSGVDLVSTENYIPEWEEPQTPFSEVLLELTPSIDQDGSIAGSLSQHFGYVQSNSYGDYVASGDLLDLFGEEDIRGDLFVEAVLPTLENGELVDKSYYFSKKFQDAPGNPVIRLSEVILIRAEAALELGNTTAALADLNLLRERANASLFTAETNLEEEIINERRRELNFEGHLFFDLARRNENVVRDQDCIAETCNLEYPSDYFVLPIPQRNINLNQNLEQNEGY